jgi:hypothetical protein
LHGATGWRIQLPEAGFSMSRRRAAAETDSINLLVGFADNIDVMVDKIYLVTGPYFLTFARFNLAVDTDQSIGNGLFGVTAALAESFELEDLVKLDKFGFELSDYVVWIAHYYSSKSI